MTYKFLIYISYSYAVAVGEPLEKEIQRRDYEVKWFADENDGEKAITHKKNALKSIKEVIAYKPDVVLTATDNVPDFITGLKVQIFHGFFAKKRPLKNGKFAHFRIRDFFDLYCTQGPSATIPFSKLAFKKGHFKVVETGWSKVDPLFPLVPKPENEIPIIFIASTFTQRLSLAYNIELLEEIKRLSQTGNYKFNMVLHPKIGDEIRTQWKNLESENFEFFDTTDLIPLFERSDIMLADTTSAIQEYLLQIKPVVTFRHTSEPNYLINISEATDLENAIIKALSLPDKLLNNIRTFVEELHPTNDGKSSARVIDACITMLKDENLNLKPKPLNLIRKFKIRKKLNYWRL